MTVQQNYKAQQIVYWLVMEWSFHKVAENGNQRYAK